MTSSTSARPPALLAPVNTGRARYHYPLHPGRPQPRYVPRQSTPMPAPVAVQRRTVLIIATLASFLTPFMSSAVNIALPSIAAEFDLDAVSLSLVASSYLFATVIFLAFAALCTPGIFASLARGSVRD